MISVCIATYNGEKFVRQQIGSILGQLGADDEIIVSDDGSTDATLEIIKGFNDNRIKIIEGPRKGLATLNFEYALKAAKGDYIFLSDQDDVWKDYKVSICMNWLSRYECIISDAEMVDNNMNILETSYFKAHGTKPGRIFNTLIKNGYMGCCMAFTRKVLDTSLPFPKDIPMHDIWIGNVAAYKYNVKFIGDKLISFRCHGNNSSFTPALKSNYSVRHKLLFRWTIIKNLLFSNKHK